MTISADEISYTENLFVKVTLNRAATGNVSVSVDGQKKQAKINNGNASVSFTGITAGFKNINVNYSGDKNYNPISGNSSVNVKKIDPSISISAIPVSYGEPLIVEVTLNSDAGGIVVVSIDGRQNTTAVNNGRASVQA